MKDFLFESFLKDSAFKDYCAKEDLEIDCNLTHNQGLQSSEAIVKTIAEIVQFVTVEKKSNVNELNKTLSLELQKLFRNEN